MPKDDESVLSCEICLLADEAETMIRIDVEIINTHVIRRTAFCRQCVAAILVAAKQKFELEGEQPEQLETAAEDQEEHK
jgi:hypothetical protein